MNYEKLDIKISQDYYANYDTKYIAELTHSGLNEHRVLVDRNSAILENKILTLAEKWNQKWKILCEKIEKENLIRDLEEKANNKNLDATQFLKNTENILYNTLEIDDTIDWDLLKDKREFLKELPKKEKLPTKPKKRTVKSKEKEELPKATDKKYEITLSLFDKIFKKRGQQKISSIKNKFELDLKETKNINENIEKENKKNIEKEAKSYQKKLNEWENSVEIINTEFNEKYKQFENEKENFYNKRQRANKLVDEFKNKYFELDTQSIEQYCDLVLSNSIYPSSFPQSYELEYSETNKSIIIDYRLPAPSDLPKIKEVKFIKSRKEIKEITLSQPQINKLFDSTLYQICLRTIHELFEADSVNALDIITFNGFVKFINKSNGKEENSCITSLQVSKEEFLNIDLSRVDPKECFKGLKGVGSSKLHGLSPIKPIIMMDRNDSRIAESYSVVDDINDSVNLAMMDWEDFENLVREIFAKEFTNEGAEVHVTQASRDGGVDAIAFDPDPIRGGKIVIQAKRYTNVVGVAAVRDLYGTVVNEGAIKGILVTTSEYGPDSYNFAKDKPLTLLSGNNLLHMLMKHGVKAKIDIKEAKKYFKENT
jgi:restriction system protein